jgi:DNA/RNA endonuclease G (NUC1)
MTLLENIKDAVVITGVIYDNNIKYLPKSRIKIPVSYYKILTINKIIYCWMGSNINGEIIITDLLTLNKIFKVNKLNLNINL